jgi:ribosomal protein S18 acetylase RimI-like enzyme
VGGFNIKINFRVLNKEEFPAVYKLMQLSFPAAEFRSYEEGLALFDLSNYQVLVVEKYGIIDAFIAEWKFQEFHYVEHFAVNPKERGNGIGTRIMVEYLQQVRLPVVIEVEASSAINAKRRIEFYKRLGFALSDMEYMQPALQSTAQDVLLRLMHYPNVIPNKTLYEIKQEIFKAVYSLNNK